MSRSLSNMGSLWIISMALWSTELASAQHTNTVSVDHLEAIQSVQTFDNLVPMVAGKATLIRVFVTFDADRPLRCSGRLSVLRANLPSITVDADATLSLAPGHDVDLDSRRNRLDQSLNFSLPSNLVVPGKVTIQLDRVVDEDIAPSPAIPCANCRSEALALNFLPVPPLKLRLVGIRYKSEDGSQAFAPRQLDFELINSWITRVYPIPSLLSSQLTIDTELRWPFDCNEVNAVLADLRTKDINGGSDEHTHYYGLVFDGNGLNSMQGCASPGQTSSSAVGSGPAGDPLNYLGLEWDTDGSLADWYAGHELGHSFGRLHPGVCGSTRADPNYPFLPTALISNNTVKAIGLDMGYAARNIRAAVLPGTTWNDMMDYCDYQWVSGYTYIAILRTMQEESGTVAFGAQLKPRTSSQGNNDNQKAQDTATPVTSNTESQNSKFLSIIGTLDFTNRTGRILFVSAAEKGNVASPALDSDVSIRFLKKDGSVIAQVPVAVQADLRQATKKTGLLNAVLPVSADCSAIEVLLGGKILDTRSLGGAEGPLVSNVTLPEAIRAPRLGAEAGAPLALVISWTGSSNPNVRYDVQLSTDHEKSWQTVAAGLTKPRATLDPAIIRGAETVIFRVIGTDGLSQTIEKAPLVQISPNKNVDLTEFVKWSIGHEGCDVYKADGTMKNVLDLRNCYLLREQHDTKATQVLSSANAEDLVAATRDAVSRIPAESDLLANFEWVCLHEGELQRFLELRAAGNYDEIRRVYYEKQLHNPNARNLLSAVTNAYISDMLEGLSIRPSRKVTLPR